MFICFWGGFSENTKTWKSLKSGPRGSFGTKKSAIDVKNVKESENRTQNPKNYFWGEGGGGPFPKIGKPGKLV